MINKKNHFNRKPEKLGERDAVHTAIVALRAGCFLKRAEYIKMNDDGEAVSSNAKDSVGVVNPFLKTDFLRAGDWFWAMMNMEDIPNVKHTWEHPKHTFEAPKCKIKRNQYLEEMAQELGTSYQSLMAALDSYVQDEYPVEYDGKYNKEELEEAMDNLSQYELWSEWENQSDYEFENCGTTCCPEYEYPGTRIFFHKGE